MTDKERELFEKKVNIDSTTIKEQLERLYITKSFSGKLVCIDFHTPRVCKIAKEFYPNATVIFMEHKDFEYIFNVSGLYYRNEEERISMLKNIDGINSLAIISNLPYNTKTNPTIGSKIVENIITNVNYLAFVNLEPTIDYDKIDGLWNHVDVDNSKKIYGGFSNEAATLPSISVITKTPCNNYTKQEFIIKCFQAGIYEKYFIYSSNKSFNYKTCSPSVETDLSKTIGFGQRLSSGNHAGKCCIGGKNTSVYKLNNNLVTDMSTLKFTCGTKIITSSPEEKLNIINTIYQPDVYLLCSALTTKMGLDNYNAKEHKLWFPKMNYLVKAYTLDEILIEHGYDNILERDEIKKDLYSKDASGNFKYKELN